MLQHRRQARVVGGRRRQADEVDARGQRRQAQLVVMLGRQIDDDQPVDPGRLGVGEEALDAIDGRSDCNSPSARSASSSSPARNARTIASVSAQRHAGFERAQPGRLDRRPVGHRIGERHAELDEVGAARRQRRQQAREGRPRRDRRR